MVLDVFSFVGYAESNKDRTHPQKKHKEETRK